SLDSRQRISGVFIFQCTGIRISPSLDFGRSASNPAQPTHGCLSRCRLRWESALSGAAPPGPDLQVRKVTDPVHAVFGGEFLPISLVARQSFGCLHRKSKTGK